jgi:proteic killer suppression protein
LVRRRLPARQRKASLDAGSSKAISARVIRTFRSRPLRRCFEAEDAGGLSAPNISRMGRMLRALDAATRPEQLNLPGYYFHALHGMRRWSIRVAAIGA